MVNYDDKRDFYRMMVNSDVTVTVLGDETTSTLLATCRDLSATGLAIEMPHPLELNTRVNVSLASANNRVQPLDVTGRVVRVNEESADSYLIGINISEID
ncbi:PilZ domain-containing protein [Thalassotalea ganghwensis]